ncbi:MAG: YeeE/YedE family protein [Myxococcales bacterium]|nr:YeeE/YedE family protein [Myxococcales bacterium]
MNVVAPLVGGGLIGLAAAGLWLLHGRIAGVSGIAGGLTTPRTGDVGWRVLFLVGLVAGGRGMVLVDPLAFGVVPLSLGGVGAAGLLVGVGVALSGGCTSGHGVCGLGRLSLRSLVAVMTFMLTGAATVYVVRHIVGGAL